VTGLLRNGEGEAVNELRALLSAELVAALERLIDARIAAALAAQQPNGSPWLTLEGAARYCFVSERTLSRMIERGQLRSTTIGRRRLMSRDDLDAFLESTRSQMRRRERT
jgi:excisionase family DNA binding protein